MLTKEAFNKELAKVTFLWNRKDFDGALNVLSEILIKGDVYMRSQALLFSGMVKQDQGFLEDSRKSWLDAIPLTNDGTFTLYLLQHNLGDSYRREGLPEKAMSWYRSAIRTCVAGDEFACDQTLTSFLFLSGDQIPEDDEAAVANAVEKSWRVLELPGDPDLTDLRKAVTQLNEGFQNLLAETERDM